jgi:hypothetical protein
MPELKYVLYRAVQSTRATVLRRRILNRRNVTGVRRDASDLVTVAV